MTQHANTTQILEAYAKLTDDELLALSHCARKLLDGTRFSEPLDLVHEALHRSLDGRRNWPTEVDFGCYMAMTMRSVACSERKKFDNRRSTTTSIEELAATHPGELPSERSAEEAAIESERSALARRVAESARASLADDEVALLVLSGMMAGQSPSETCQSHRIDPKAFDSARHRVMRRIKSMAHVHGSLPH